MDQNNSRAVGATVLPTPEGHEELPLPRAQGASPTQRPYTAPEGGILPPQGGEILPPAAPESMPDVPAEPGIEAPTEEGGLPGLPLEPESSLLPPAFKSGQPKEEPKSLEPLPTKESPKPSKADEATPGAWRKNTERTTTETQPVERRDTERATVVSLAEFQPPEPNHAPFVPGHAQSITVVVDEPEATEIEAAAYSVAESTPSPEPSDEVVGIPPIALDGYCPVELIRNGRWVQGDLRWTVVRDGLIYRLSGPAQRQQFLAHPEAFTPACSGNDPVLTMDEQRTVAGRTACCATYNGRLYMFSSTATQSRFNKNPQRYVVEK